MFLAQDTTRNLPLHKHAENDMPPLVNKLSPEDSRNIEINEMIKNANNTIHVDHGEPIEDITIMPLKDKKVSLGRPVFDLPGGTRENMPISSVIEKKKKQRRPSPLSDWAAVATTDDVELMRNVHQEHIYNNNKTEREIEINELQKMKKYSRRKGTNAIRKLENNFKSGLKNSFFHSYFLENS